MARQIAGLLGYLSLQRSDRVTIVPFSSGILPVFGPAQGRAAVTPMLSYLTGLRADGETNLKKALVVGLQARTGDLVTRHARRRDLQQQVVGDASEGVGAMGHGIPRRLADARERAGCRRHFRARW